jgi:hypothetical protein
MMAHRSFGGIDVNATLVLKIFMFSFVGGLVGLGYHMSHLQNSSNA